MSRCRASGAGTAALSTRSGGFTLVELVVVIAILTLLAAVAAPRFFNTGVYEERAWFDELAGAFGYARDLAIASGCAVRVELTASSYTLTQQASSSGHCDSNDTSWSTAVVMSDGSASANTAPASVSNAPPVTVVFSPAGTTSLGADLVITAGSRSFTLDAASGYVQQ